MFLKKGVLDSAFEIQSAAVLIFDYFLLVLSFLPEKVPQSNEGDSSDTSEGESTSSEMEHTMDTSVSSAPSASSTPAHAVTPPIQG